MLSSALALLAGGT
jgi:hypothetical protein